VVPPVTDSGQARPAAIITGTLACARGHWKALIGIALAAAGLAVWAALPNWRYEEA
jgi:hypothetical protein